MPARPVLVRISSDRRVFKQVYCISAIFNAKASHWKAARVFGSGCRGMAAGSGAPPWRPAARYGFFVPRRTIADPGRRLP